MAWRVRFGFGILRLPRAQSRNAIGENLPGPGVRLPLHSKMLSCCVYIYFPFHLLVQFPPRNLVIKGLLG